MKISELKSQIEEIITEILSEVNDDAQKKIDTAVKNQKVKPKDLRDAADDLERKKDSTKLASVALNAGLKESDDDEFDTLDDTASDKESNKYAKEEEKKNKKANKKRDEIVSAYKKIAGDIKAKAKAANSGDKEAKAWILKHQDTIKAYNKLKN